MSETQISGTLLLFLLLLTPSAATGLESSYDEFDASKISAEKWVGGEGASQLGREATRAIENHQLRLRNRSVGFTDSDSGAGKNFVFLGLPDPDSTGDMIVNVTATKVNDVGCGDNTTPTVSFAGLIGSFFNAGTPNSGDATNDIVAAVGISSDSDRVAANKRPQVVSYVLQCADQSCDTYSILDFHIFGGIDIGALIAVQVLWNRQIQKFWFSAIGDPHALRFQPHDYFYGNVVTDRSPPGLPFKHLQAENDVANCTTGPRPVANISALYDTVRLAPTCQVLGASCGPSNPCCDLTTPPQALLADCNAGVCCSINLCSTNEDCCAFSPEVLCGGQGPSHCCLPTGAPCSDGGSFPCCNGGVCLLNDLVHESGNCA